MREIKFRAWHIELSQMYEVFTINFDTCFVGLDPDYNFPANFKYIKLMQYTGLNDKNGKEIYEGDILKHDLTGTDDPVHGFYFDWYIVKFNVGFFEIRNVGGDKARPVFPDNSIMEIAGNIYENPELLS